MNRPPAVTAVGIAALLWSLAGMAGPTALSGQAGTMTGTVRDAATLRPLESAQVSLAGTSLGGLTNARGQYILLNVPVGEVTVRVQLLGYLTATTTATVEAGQTTELSFDLRQTVIALEEIVVTGAGQATEKRKLGNTIATIDRSSLQDAPVATVSELLTGREPGVVNLPSGGLTGEGSKIRIRGSASLSQSNEPIIYLDGVRVDRAGGFGTGVGAGGGGSPSRLDDINPDAIERIEVLKGAAAATLYGSEASNGVIQIFTKSGTIGAPRWTARSEVGTVTYDGDAWHPNAGFARTVEQAATMSQLFGRQVSPFEVIEVPMVKDLLTETGIFTTHSIGVQGGTPGFTYFVNGRYQYENGPFGGEFMCQVGCGQDKNRKGQASVAMNVVPTDRLSLRLSTLYSEANHQTPNNGNNPWGAPSITMGGQPQRATCPGGVAGYLRCEGPGNPSGASSFATVAEAMQVETNQDVQHFTGSIAATYEVVDGLNLGATFGVDFVNQRSYEFKPFGYDVDGVVGDSPDGERTLNDRNASQLTVDIKGAWNTPLGERLSSDLVLGAQGFIEEATQEWGSGDIFPGPGLEVIGAANVLTIGEDFLRTVNAGLFVQEQIGYDDYLFLTLGGRLDFNSAFGESEAGQFYPKASLSYVPTASASWVPEHISTLRFRGAVGQSGLQPGAFDKFTTFRPQSSELGPGVAPDNLGNESLRPEIATEWELGAEAGLFDDRLGVELTYWDRVVSDALVARQFPLSGGFRLPQLDNIGEIRSHGIELGVRGLAHQSRGFSLELFANAAFLREEVTDMGGAPPIKTGGSYTRYRNFLIEGAAPGAFFGARLADVPAGSLAVDLDGDGVADTETEVLAALSGPFDIGTVQSPTLMLADDDGDGDLLDHPLGKPIPDWAGSFGFTMHFMSNFRLSSMFEYKTGNFSVLNLTDAFRKSNPSIGRNVRSSAEVEATMLNPQSSAQQRLDALKVWVNELVALFPQSGLNSVEAADFVRWRELSLTYEVPERYLGRLGVDGLSMTLGGRNIMMWTRYSGIDPESTLSGRDGLANPLNNNFIIGTDLMSMPIPRRWTFAVSVDF